MTKETVMEAAKRVCFFFFFLFNPLFYFVFSYLWYLGSQESWGNYTLSVADGICAKTIYAYLLFWLLCDSIILQILKTCPRLDGFLNAAS